MVEYDPEKSPTDATCPECGSTNAEAAKDANIRCGDCGCVANYREW